MYKHIGSGGIVGVLSINGNGVYPPAISQLEEIANPDHVPEVIQDAQFPVEFVAIGISESKLVVQEFVVQNIDQYRYARDNFTKYCIIAPAAAVLPDKLTQMKFIPNDMMVSMQEIGLGLAAPQVVLPYQLLVIS